MPKHAFITELPFNGPIPESFRNMRTEFAWMYALGAMHYNIAHYMDVADFDHVYLVFPKGSLFLSAEGIRLVDGHNPVSRLLGMPLLEQLKARNKKVHFVQEGPHWWFNDYEVVDQFRFIELISKCDSILAHSAEDMLYYSGLFPDMKVDIIHTLMIPHVELVDIVPVPEDKAIIGGNFCRWYGGFESYVVAQEFGVPLYVQTSHATRENENMVSGLTHLPRMEWVDWMKALSSFKYAVHLMPTVAAGTLYMNCAYWGIPCIGNEEMHTAARYFPDLVVDVNDIGKARRLAMKLVQDADFYGHVSTLARALARQDSNADRWKTEFESRLES